MGSQGRPFPPIMAVKFVALVVLIFSVKADANAETERDGWDLSTGCNNSEPFFIKNRSTKTKKPYLTVDLATNAVNGGAKTGEENQQWMWSQCYSAIHLVNVATGGCLTREGKGGLASTDECRDNSFWELYDGILSLSLSMLVLSNGSLPCGLSTLMRLSTLKGPPPHGIGSSGTSRMCNQPQLSEDPEEPI